MLKQYEKEDVQAEFEKRIVEDTILKDLESKRVDQMNFIRQFRNDIASVLVEYRKKRNANRMENVKLAGLIRNTSKEKANTKPLQKLDRAIHSRRNQIRRDLANEAMRAKAAEVRRIIERSNGPLKNENI